MNIEELSEEHESAFLAMVEDFAKDDEASYREFFAHKPKGDAFAFKKFLLECRKQRQDWRPKAGFVSFTHYVMLDADRRHVAAYGRMRFPLNEISEIDGGNLEFAVPPSRRKTGNGSVCLSLMLFEAVRAGLRRALVTCPADNLAARTVIERNRGQLQDVVASGRSPHEGRQIARYWISFR